jgi:DNA-binding NarL/FixJ family response regulator
MIRVLLVDDHEAILRGLTSVLDESEGFSVVGTAGDGLEALRLADDLRPDVIVMDMSMREMDGVATIEGILAGDPAARVLVLSSYGQPSRVDQALRAGACGFLVKGEPVADVRAAVRQAHDGEQPLSKSLLPGLRRLRGS